MKWWLAAVLIVGSVASSAAQMAMVPREFFNDTLLYSAQEDVAKLDIDGLRLLADVLAECNNPYDSTGIARGCSVKSVRFLIEYGQDHSLGQLWEATSTSFSLSAQMSAKERTDFYRRGNRIIGHLSKTVADQLQKMRKK